MYDGGDAQRGMQGVPMEHLHEGEERKHVLGLPVPAAPPEGELPKSIFGFPVSQYWEGWPTIHIRRIAHPVRWAKWRLQVHRLGPYTLDFDESGPNRSDQ